MRSSNILTLSSGIGSIVTFITIVGIPVLAGLFGLSLFDTTVSGFTTTFIRKYQKKLTKVTKLYDTVIPALSVIENKVSEAFKNGNIDEKEFETLQKLYFNVFKDLANIDRKMREEMRVEFEKNFLEEIKNLRNTIKTNNLNAS